MFYKMIEAKRNEWLASETCTVKAVIDYIVKTGQMRDAQVEAIKTYLFLKIACGCKPLAELFCEGAFNTLDLDDSPVNISKKTKLLRHCLNTPVSLTMQESRSLPGWNSRSAKNRKALIAMRSSTKPFMIYLTPTTCSVSPWAQARPI